MKAYNCKSCIILINSIMAALFSAKRKLFFPILMGCLLLCGCAREETSLTLPSIQLPGTEQQLLRQFKVPSAWGSRTLECSGNIKCISQANSSPEAAILILRFFDDKGNRCEFRGLPPTPAFGEPPVGFCYLAADGVAKHFSCKVAIPKSAVRVEIGLSRWYNDWQIEIQDFMCTINNAIDVKYTAYGSLLFAGGCLMVIGVLMFRKIMVPKFVERYLFGEAMANLLFCCTPLIVLLVVLFLMDVNPFRWVPLQNDEVGWYMQVNSVVEHGTQPGFTGYNETHAAIGRFGPWGVFMVYLMALFGKVFGWQWYSPLFMNVFFLMLANLAFFLFVRPKRHVALKLAFLNFVSFLQSYYMFTGMSECTRFSLSIVLAGLFFFLLKDENRGKRSYFIVLGIIAPIVLFLFVNCYILFAVLLPVYGYVWYRYLNPVRFRSLSFVFLCVILPVCCALVCVFLQIKTSAPYPISTLGTYLAQPNLAAFWEVFTNTVVANFKSADIPFIFNNSKLINGCASSYLLFYYLLAAVSVAQLAITFKNSKKICPLNLLVVYVLFIFVLAFFIVYSSSAPWTYIRGLNVALVFSLYLVCVFDWPKMQLFFLGFAFMQLFPFMEQTRDELCMRYSFRNCCGGGYELFERYATVFPSKLIPSESKDPWDNTVALYGLTYNINCVIPSGLSWNYIMDGHPVSKPRYVMTDKSRDWIFAGYEKTYSDDLINIFEKIVKSKPTDKKEERLE